jgi:2-oxoglutarate dehydrogenase E1 component
MTPKSLLRLAECSSSFADLTNGEFSRVLPDTNFSGSGGTWDPKQVSRILLCTGKLYYDLEKERIQLGIENVAIIRIEQLYPFPEDELRDILAPYPDEVPVFWTQEEPENMGAWRFIHRTVGERVVDRFPLLRISRKASASPATGSASAHKIEQEKIIAKALDKQVELHPEA